MHQKMDFEIIRDVLGNEELVMKVQAEKTVQLARTYLEHLTDVDMLAQSLIAMIDTINPYFYEMYLSIIMLLREMDTLPEHMEQWSRILLFLQLKMVRKRRRPVGQVENDWWLDEKHEDGALPKIAEFRFSFKSVLDDEIMAVLGKQLILILNILFDPSNPAILHSSITSRARGNRRRLPSMATAGAAEKRSGKNRRTRNPSHRGQIHNDRGAQLDWPLQNAQWRIVQYERMEFAAHQ